MNEPENAFNDELNEQIRSKDSKHIVPKDEYNKAKAINNKPDEKAPNTKYFNADSAQ
jgi:hypothetical protein